MLRLQGLIDIFEKGGAYGGVSLAIPSFLGGMEYASGDGCAIGPFLFLLSIRSFM